MPQARSLAMKYYLIAGEKSGDLHGSNLLKELKKIDSQAQFKGFGGDEMQKAGMTVRVHYSQMAFMGIVQALLNIRKISQWLSFCKEDIKSFNPDVIILIDYGGFNMRVAKFAKASGFKVFYYISPKVWAWNVGRAWKLKATVDHMFCILPFEKNFFKKFEWDVDYVGNPVLDAVKAFVPDPKFLAENRLEGRGKLVAILPGSRKIELERLGPLLAAVAKNFSQYHFVVAAIRELPEDLYAPFKALTNASLVHDVTYDLLTNAHAAIVTSGTATLETGLFKVPQVVVYKASALEYAIGSRLVKVDHISLVNLVANKSILREFIQHKANEENVSDEMARLLEDDTYRTTMLAGYQEVYKILDVGSASATAAQKMIRYLRA
jgi:lipid-A-disaccharide synthase